VRSSREDINTEKRHAEQGCTRAEHDLALNRLLAEVRTLPVIQLYIKVTRSHPPSTICMLRIICCSVAAFVRFKLSQNAAVWSRRYMRGCASLLYLKM
jgi:hypothetical protein